MKSLFNKINIFAATLLFAGFLMIFIVSISGHSAYAAKKPPPQAAAAEPSVEDILIEIKKSKWLRGEIRDFVDEKRNVVCYVLQPDADFFGHGSPTMSCVLLPTPP